MNTDTQIKVLRLQLNTVGYTAMTVSGDSMIPALSDGDVVTLKQEDQYHVGDILVYLYKEGKLLIHRLLRIYNGRYYCKGDNSLRLEDVDISEIIGKVVLVNGNELPPNSPSHTKLSYAINRLFVKKYRYDSSKLVNDHLYKHYKNIVINKGASFMLYQTNPNLEYIQTDEHSKVAFDQENKTTFFLDEVSQDILEVMKEPKALENVVEELSKLYDAPKEEISNDVEVFLTDAITKNLVVTK